MYVATRCSYSCTASSGNVCFRLWRVAAEVARAGPNADRSTAGFNCQGTNELSVDMEAGSPIFPCRRADMSARDERTRLTLSVVLTRFRSPDARATAERVRPRRVLAV